MLSSAARAMCATRAAARQADDRAARVGLPVRRAQAGEGRHEHHAAAVGHALGELLHLAAALDRLQAVAQPLHHRPADEDAAFERELGRRRRLRGAGRDQAVRAGLEPRAGVHQHEAAGAVGVLRQPGLEARLAEQRALLVAGDATDRQRRAEPARPSRGRRRGWTGAPAAAPRRGTSSDRQQLGVPGVVVHVQHQRARGVADVGRVKLAAGQHPHQPGVDGAEGELAAFGGSARAGHVVEDPLQLGAREVGVDDQAGLGAEGVGAARARAARRRSARRAGPARRSRCRRARRSGGSTPAWSRAGW